MYAMKIMAYLKANVSFVEEMAVETTRALGGGGGGRRERERERERERQRERERETERC